VSQELKLKNLVILEITALIILLISVFAYIEVTTYLGSSQNAEIGLYIEKVYAKGNVTVLPGETAIARFTFLSYEPTILVLELTFRSVDEPGYLLVRCNNRLLHPIIVSQANSTVSLNAVSVSGAEWVEPLSAMFGFNEVTFEAGSEKGFEGVVEYQIKLRGTR
jgi:hypothetical protein